MCTWMRAGLFFFLSGCVSNIKVEPVLERPPLVESLPLTVGIYFSPEFRTYRGSQCGFLYCNEYDLGPQSVALFEIIAAGLFDKVRAIDSMPSTDSNLNVAGILAPTIADFDVGNQQITYRVTLYSPAGSEIGAWEVNGFTIHPFLPGTRTRLAMRDAAAKFVKGFRKEPVVMRWLEDAGIKLPSPTQPQSEEGTRP